MRMRQPSWRISRCKSGPGKAVAGSLADPKIKARLADDLGGALLALSPADFGKHIKAE
jgi:hypothetical protein